MSDIASRPARADAVRNRQRILNAARDQITTAGPSVGMVEIARAAGVAVGTLYRHFPTKTDLIAAVLSAFAEQVADQAEATLHTVETDGVPAGKALQDFLEFVLDASAVNHAVKTVAQSLGGGMRGDDPHEARAARALKALLNVGQVDGTVRPGVSVSDVYLLISSAPLEQPKAARLRWLELVSPGLIPQ